MHYIPNHLAQLHLNICNGPFKGMFAIPSICFSCLCMLPLMIKAELNYIRWGSCVAEPAVCLSRSHTHTYTHTHLLPHGIKMLLSLLSLQVISPRVKGRRPQSIAVTQFRSVQVNKAGGDAGTCLHHWVATCISNSLLVRQLKVKIVLVVLCFLFVFIVIKMTAAFTNVHLFPLMMMRWSKASDLTVLILYVWDVRINLNK